VVQQVDLVCRSKLGFSEPGSQLILQLASMQNFKLQHKLVKRQ